MSAFVTGGTGFLGRRLVERLLAEGRAVAVLARRGDPELRTRGVRMIEGSIVDPAAVSAGCRGAETVFHVAAKVGVWGRYEEFYRANVEGTRTVLAACREAGVRHLVFTSTPSVVYNGSDLSGVDESLPLTRNCPSPYPLTKALAEAEVLAADSSGLRTLALRPHLIWGPGDPHLAPRLMQRSRSGRLRVIGRGENRVDLVYIENAVDAHLLAEAALRGGAGRGRAYFITNRDPVPLWPWINQLLSVLGQPPVTRRMPLPLAMLLAAGFEGAWRLLGRNDEPPLTRFVAAELAHDHWFRIDAARRDLGYEPRVSMAEGMALLARSLGR